MSELGYNSKQHISFTMTKPRFKVLSERPEKRGVVWEFITVLFVHTSYVLVREERLLSNVAGMGRGRGGDMGINLLTCVLDRSGIVQNVLSAKNSVDSTPV